MSIDNTLRNYDQAVNVLGRSGLNLAFPNEFELYVCALELKDSVGKTQSYFIFPVMPNSINERIPQINNIKKTNNGITTLFTPSYVPSTINIQGNFGRKFKFVLNGSSIGDLASSFTNDDMLLPGTSTVDALSIASGLAKAFDQNVKTGYGMTKILESIITASKSLDKDGNGYTLIFHNLAFNRVQIVRVEDFSITMDQGTNMIWNYNLQMTSLGDATQYFTQPSTLNSLQSTSFQQKAIGNVLDKVSKLVNKI